MYSSGKIGDFTRLNMQRVPAAPKVNMPKGAKGRKMKGGAVLGEQFERMLAAVPKVRPKDAPEWQRYLTGLWLSGLRLQESIALSWDSDSPFAVDLSGKRPRFRIRGQAQKSGQDELLPMTPDFAEFLLQTPEAERAGQVFKLAAADSAVALTAHSVGKLVSEIGERAGAIVNAVDAQLRRRRGDGSKTGFGGHRPCVCGPAGVVGRNAWRRIQGTSTGNTPSRRTGANPSGSGGGAGGAAVNAGARPRISSTGRAATNTGFGLPQ